MKKITIVILVGLSFLAVTSQASELKNTKSLIQFLRIDANPKKGFNYPFYLYIPTFKLEGKVKLLVLSNNTSEATDSFEVHDKAARDEALKWRDLSEATSSVLLVPAFPRLRSQSDKYTHALDRDTMLVREGDLKRIDLQLIKMTEEAKKIVQKNLKKEAEKKLYLFGFSASAMFVNRFSFIHPDLVAAVVFGAPGGWPIVPIAKFQDKELRYPIGIFDVEKLTGKPVDMSSLKKIPFYIFLGSKDENDSVIFRDGYDLEDEQLVFSLFGKKPVERWPIAEKIYKDEGMNAIFHLYEGLGHGTNKLVFGDIVNFFKDK